MTYTIDQYIEAHIEDVCEPVHMDRVEVTDDTLPAWMVALGDASEFAAFITVAPLDGALVVSIAGFVDGLSTREGTITVRLERDTVT